jgi:hypothetical protein
MLDLGPQYPKDDAFTARMRLHQSWYRSAVLKVPCGVGPQAKSTARYGNMLRDEDGERGLTFLTPEISAYAMRRQRELPGGIKRHRLLCNLMSSQPMCFNLMGPIALGMQGAEKLVGALVGIDDVRRVVRVIVEHAPSPAAEYLGDLTSFDAFIEYERADGRLYFVGIETKLTEPFSADRYPLSERPAYSRWLHSPSVPWREEKWADLDDVGHNQLFRDHLLAVALAERDRQTYAGGSLVLVRHPGDTKCARAVATYRECLHDPLAFVDRPLDGIVRRWAPIVRGTPWESWLSAFERRFVDLRDSEEYVGRTSVE